MNRTGAKNRVYNSVTSLMRERIKNGEEQGQKPVSLRKVTSVVSSIDTLPARFYTVDA